VFVTVRNRQAERIAQLVAETSPPSVPTTRSYVALAKLSIRRKSGWNGWLQSTLLRKHALTDCGCGLINCRA
jgi:hypothetical protein